MADSDNTRRTTRARPPLQKGRARPSAPAEHEPTVIHREEDPFADDAIQPTVIARGPKADRDALTGMKLGEYEVQELVAQGGMGLVYRGRHPLIGKQVAIKVLLPHVAQDKVQVQRLVEEARIVNAIRHPNIVDIFSLGQLTDGRSYLVMEFLEGEPLGQILERRGRLTVAQTLSVLDQTFAALQAAHEAGAIHRDLKPGNLFITPLKEGTWRVKVVDFGIAKVAGARASTAPDTVLGTPGYMAPEQIRSEGVSPATDLYAMGVCAYRMLTGREPFSSPRLVDLLDMHLDAPVPPLGPLPENVPPALEMLVMQLLEKNPAQRPPSAKAARAVILELLDASKRGSRKRQDAPSAKVPRALWFAVIGLGAALLAALGYIALG